MPTKNGRKKKPSKIEKLPLEVRKKILWITVTAITFIILVIWLFSFSSNLSKISNQPKNESEIKKTAQDLGDIIFEAKEQFGKIKDKIIPSIPEITEEEQPSTSTQNLTPEQIELLKQELENISTTTPTTTQN